jgi:MacB-like periplasmic core domain
VGVVGDVRQASLGIPPRPEIAVSPMQSHLRGGSATIVARTEGDPKALAESLRAAVHSANPLVPISRIATVDDVVSNSIVEPRLYATLLGAFALLALVLASTFLRGAHRASTRSRLCATNRTVMRTIRVFCLRIADVFMRGRRDRDIDEELASHVQLHVDDNVRAGMTPGEARRVASITLGGIAQTTERYRDRRGLPALDALRQDVVYAVRVLRKNPGFTATAVLTLALGIGANTAIFSVVNAVLLRPLPFKDSTKLVLIFATAKNGNRHDVSTYPDFADWRSQNRSFTDMAAYTSRSMTIGLGDEAVLAQGKRVTPNIFDVLGVQPAMGRAFRREEDRPGSSGVVILSDGFWQQYFGGSPSALGQTIRINEEAHTIVGVMPPEFQLDDWERFYVPLPIDPSRGHGFLRVALDLWLPQPRFAQRDARARFYDDALQRVQALPGVRSAAFVADLPLNGGTDSQGFHIVGRPDPAPGKTYSAGFNIATAGYFETMGIPVKAGREFTDSDRAATTPVIVINETAARTFWPGESPIGRQINLPLSKNMTVVLTVVGVTGNVRHVGLAVPPRSEIFLNSMQAPLNWSWLVLAVRAHGDPALLAESVKVALHEVNPNVPIERANTLDDVVSRSIVGPRIYAFLLGTFAALAAVLAAIGLYGLISYTVSQRTHELGVRVALGAARTEIVRLVIGQGLRLAVVGALVGLAGAFATTRLLAGLVKGIEPNDPATFGVVTMVLLAAALLAAYLPARRASRVDPMVALRAD